MRRFLVLLALALGSLGVVLAQNAPPDQAFTLIHQFGKLRPQGILYDANYDRLVWVDPGGRLLLVDAATLETERVLHESGLYNSYVFSNDGRYLALAIDRRIELWDTESGDIAASIEPAVNLTTGPLQFSDDDRLLLFNSVVPAPADIRRSENDTTNLPWLWDLAAARNEAESMLFGQEEEELYAFFNYRNGLVLGANNTVIAGIPERLLIIDADNPRMPIVNEIAAPQRFEQDPISVWRSARDGLLYVRPTGQNNFVQVKTEDNTTYDIPLGRELSYRNLSSVEGLTLSSLARIIGEPVSRGENSLLRLILGDDYRTYINYAPLTVILIDVLEPLTPGTEQSGLLIYTFNEDTGRGVLEFIRPSDIVNMVLHPDNNHLMVRRQNGVQPLEVYNLNTGALEKSLYPAVPDFDGRQLLAYNQTGDQILTDFQRIDAETGATLVQDTAYAANLGEIVFTSDSRALVGIEGNNWRVWDIATGELIREERLSLRGGILQRSPDAHRYLTQLDAGQLEVVNMGTDERRIFTVTPPQDTTISQIVPNPDWSRFLVVYSLSPSNHDYPGNAVAVYDFDGTQYFFASGADLPSLAGRGYGWLDDNTIYVSTQSQSSDLPPARLYGIVYHETGLPMCLVEVYPADWPRWVGLWERFNTQFQPAQLNRLTERLCATLPFLADDVALMLTPTPRAVYYGAATLVPLEIAGVPACLTRQFRREALDYAELWRSMTDGLTPEQVVELEAMLCEGLIPSLNYVPPTATVNPNQFNPPTQTPLPDAPESVDTGTIGQLQVMAIDIRTGARSVGGYFPPTPVTPSPNLNLILRDYRETFNRSLDSATLSPDGTLLAGRDQNGFVVVYRLEKPYNVVAGEATAVAQATRDAAPRSIGLLPTATQPFEYVGAINPTLTPTVTLTPPPTAEATAAQPNLGQVVELCPSRSLYTLDSPPPSYAATGRILVQTNDVIPVWVLEPETGRYAPDDTIPPLLTLGFSFDENWVMNRSSDIVISRPDGTDRTVLFRALPGAPVPGNIGWWGLHTFYAIYERYLPEYPYPVPVIQRFDPATGVLTDPVETPPSIRVNELPSDTLTVQPDDERYALVATYYPTADGRGTKYYIYDRQSDTAAHFASLDTGGLEFSWHPLGHTLYYRYPNNRDWFMFDTRTNQHSHLGSLPGGVWSRDGRYRARWDSDFRFRQIERLAAGELPPKITIWDSETGLIRRYCLPQTGLVEYDSPLLWSPDNRYLLFRIQLPYGGDSYSTPMPTPTPEPTGTPVPLELQYELRNLRTVVLDTETGEVTIISGEADQAVVWTQDTEGDAS
jgi:WD40 repeat protein